MDNDAVQAADDLVDLDELERQAIAGATSGELLRLLPRETVWRLAGQLTSFTREGEDDPRVVQYANDCNALATILRVEAWFRPPQDGEQAALR